MRINHNISALKANNTLAKNNGLLDKSLEKLSSGYRINRSADDAAGLAISQKMRTQIAGLDQASRNGADGISVIQTAEGALAEVESMLQRMRELSVQAANGTNTDEDRAAIQQEIDELNNEIERISSNTEFNTKALLDGNIDRKSYSNINNVEMISLSDGVAPKDFSITITQDARQAVIACDGFTFSDGSEKIGQGGTLNINGVDIEISANDTYEGAFEKIRNSCNTMNIRVFSGEYVGPDGTDEEGKPLSPDYAFYEPQKIGEAGIVFMTEAYGSDEKIEIKCDNQELSNIFGIDTAGAKAVGVDAAAVLNNGFETTATVSGKGNIITISDRDNFEVKILSAAGTAQTSFTDATGSTEQEEPSASTDVEVTISVLNAGPMDLQIGANEGQTMVVRIPKVDPVTLGIDHINVCTEDGAQRAITMADNAIQQVSSIRAKLGAYQNRLDHAITNLDVSSENITEALSRIADTDMAKEMADYTQKNVLAQANTSMLAQANQRPQTILSLLQA